MQVYHAHPLGHLVVGETVMTDPVQDLWPVCPNCHALIHNKGQDEEYTIEEAAEGRAVQVEDQPDLGAAHRTVEGAGPGSGKVGVGFVRGPCVDLRCGESGFALVFLRRPVGLGRLEEIDAFLRDALGAVDLHQVLLAVEQHDAGVARVLDGPNARIKVVGEHGIFAAEQVAHRHVYAQQRLAAFRTRRSHHFLMLLAPLAVRQLDAVLQRERLRFALNLVCLHNRFPFLRRSGRAPPTGR